MRIDWVQIATAFMVMFAVIDIFGSIPIILSIKSKGGRVKAWQVTLVSFLVFMAFLFLGESILKLFSVDISSFAIAGSFIIF